MAFEVSGWTRDYGENDADRVCLGARGALSSRSSYVARNHLNLQTR